MSRWARAELYEGDSVYERKALTDTEYAAYLVDFTRRVLGLTHRAGDADHLADHRARPGRHAGRSGGGCFELLALNYVQLTPTGPYKFTIVEMRPGDGAGRRRPPGQPRWRTPGRRPARPAERRPAPATGGAPAAVTEPRGAPRRVGFRENMDIKFLRPHELVVSKDTAPGGVTAVANGSEAKIADAMLRVLHHQGLLADGSHDLRFNMRPGGNPGRGEFGGVVEAFLTPGEPGAAEAGSVEAGDGAAAGRRIELINRFGEPVLVERAGVKIDAAGPPAQIASRERGGARPTACWRELAAAAAAGACRPCGRSGRAPRDAGASSVPDEPCRPRPSGSSTPPWSA